MFHCAPHHHLTNSLCYTFLLLKQLPQSTATLAFLQKKKGDISNYLLTVCFCLKSLPPASLSSLHEGKLEKEYADIVKLNLIGTVKTARVW